MKFSDVFNKSSAGMYDTMVEAELNSVIMTETEAWEIIESNPVYVSGDDDLSDPIAVANMVIDRKADDLATMALDTK